MLMPPSARRCSRLCCGLSTLAALLWIFPVGALGAGVLLLLQPGILPILDGIEDAELTAKLLHPLRPHRTRHALQDTGVRGNVGTHHGPKNFLHCSGARRSLPTRGSLDRVEQLAVDEEIAPHTRPRHFIEPLPSFLHDTLPGISADHGRIGEVVGRVANVLQALKPQLGRRHVVPAALCFQDQVVSLDARVGARPQQLLHPICGPLRLPSTGGTRSHQRLVREHVRLDRCLVHRKDPPLRSITLAQLGARLNHGGVRDDVRLHALLLHLFQPKLCA
mmetsp:Transcript_158045/g.506948  ORF Transcript_158045/g.506948 Transcript_158045/m.506948 type:complete len:277 (+) Transcript_158045:774-1604(+)